MELFFRKSIGSFQSYTPSILLADCRAKCNLEEKDFGKMLAGHISSCFSPRLTKLHRQPAHDGGMKPTETQEIPERARS